MNEPETNRTSIPSWVFILVIALSWKVLSPIEIIADCALLLAICRFLGNRGRIACLVLLGLFLVAAWADWLVIDFLVTSVLRGGRHVGLISLAVFILFVMWRRHRPTDRIAWRWSTVLYALGLLAFAGFGVFASLLIPSSISRFVPIFVVLSITGYLLYKRAPRNRWRRFTLIYPVGLLVLTGFAYQLFLDWEYLKTMRLASLLIPSSISRFVPIFVVLSITGYLIYKRAPRNRWRRFTLIYPVGLFVLTGFAYQLFLDWEYLKTMRLVESGRVGKREAGTTEPSPALFDALHHDDPASRANAVKILVGHFMMWEHDRSIMIMSKNQKDIFSKDQWWKHTYWDGNWPAPVTQRVMPRLIELLHDDSFEVKMQSLGALHHVGPRARPAVPALRALLRAGENASVSPVNAEAVVELLMMMTKAMSGEFQPRMKLALIRASVAEALGTIGPKAHEAVPELIPLLQDILWPIRIKAADALGRIGPFAREALPALETAAKDEIFGDRSRIAAAVALWRIEPNHPLVIPTFREILEDGTADGQTVVLGRLSSMGPRVADWAVPLLTLLLKRDDQNGRAAAFTTLCEIGAESADAVESILSAIESESVDELTQAVDAIGPAVKSGVGAEIQKANRKHNHSGRPFDSFTQLLLKVRGPAATTLATAIRTRETKLMETLQATVYMLRYVKDPDVAAALKEVDWTRLH
jgi:HEAT repeat protein